MQSVFTHKYSDSHQQSITDLLSLHVKDHGYSLGTSLPALQDLASHTYCEHCDAALLSSEIV